MLANELQTPYTLQSNSRVIIQYLHKNYEKNAQAPNPRFKREAVRGRVVVETRK